MKILTKKKWNEIQLKLTEQENLELDFQHAKARLVLAHNKYKEYAIENPLWYRQVYKLNEKGCDCIVLSTNDADYLLSVKDLEAKGYTRIPDQGEYFQDKTIYSKKKVIQVEEINGIM